MTLQQFLNSRKDLFWYIENPNTLSFSACVEHILNYGDFSDIHTLIRIAGKRRVATAFFSRARQKRTNYPPSIRHYFSLYFRNYA